MDETYSFKAIWDAIYQKALEIQNTTERIGAVYNHDIKIENWVSLPAIIITPSNGNVNILDSCNYENQINFTVRLIDRIDDWMAEVEDNMRVVADMLLKALQEIGSITRTNANWLTVKSLFNYQWWFANTQEPLRVFQVECMFTAIEK